MEEDEEYVRLFNIILLVILMIMVAFGSMYLIYYISSRIMGLI